MCNSLIRKPAVYRRKYQYFFMGVGVLEFRRVLKREFHAMNYGSFTAYKLWKDFLSMYEMGGEL